MIQKIYPTHTFHKILKRDNVYKLFMTPSRTFLPSINTLACSKAEIYDSKRRYRFRIINF